MNPPLSPSSEDRQQEITVLLQTLQATRQRLQELAAEEASVRVLPPDLSTALHQEIAERKQVEDHLSASETLLRLFIEHTPAAIAMLDTEMRYIQTSKRWLQDYHIAGQSIIGRTHYEIFPETPERWKAIHARVLAGASEHSDEDSFERADGSTDWLQWEAIPWHKAGGAIGGLIFFTQVITARKQAEKALQQSEESYRQTAARLAKVLDSTLDVICTFDASGHFTQVNAACESVWGYRPEELLGTLFFDLVHPDDLEKTRAIDTRILAGKRVLNFENRYIRKDGSVAHMLWSAWWSEADQSNFCVAHDITETRKADAAARALAERLELATKAGKLGIWDWNIATGEVIWDAQMHTLYGTDPEESHVDTAFVQRHVHPDDWEGLDSAVAIALMPDAAPLDTSYRITIPGTQQIRHIRAQGQVFRDASGQAIRMLGTNWDATLQVEREEVLQQKLESERHLLRRALAGEKAKSEFLAVMSHEIRTPLNGVIGFAEMLTQSPNLSPEDRDFSQTIVTSSEALLRILDDVLDFSRIEAGRLPIEIEHFSPRELVDDLHLLFVSQIHKKGLQFLISVDSSVPAVVLGDAGRLRQILVNLIGNALKFTEKGAITLNARISCPSENELLEFTVQDTGEGIAPDRAEAIFEPFTQEDSSTSRRHGGTGLGLSISRRLAGLMGGELRLIRPPEGGSLFVLRLPFTASEMTEDDDSVRSTDLLPKDTEFAMQYPQRILVVEDDLVNLKLIVSVLRKLGYEPLIAHHGLEAIKLFTRERPDCILMDMQMPEMDGIEATNRIRALEASCRLEPVFISGLTANILDEDHRRCLHAGMNVCLNKPVKRQAIAATLIQAWESRHHLPS